MDGQQWTVTDELLAIVAERVDAWGLINARLHTDKKQQKHLPKKPLRVPRPGEAQREGVKPERPARRKPVDDPDKADAFFTNTPKF